MYGIWFHLLSAYPLLDFGYDGCEYREQFICFFTKRLQFWGRNNIGLHQQFQPVISLVQFLQCGLELIDDIGIRLCSMAFAIMRANRCA